MLKVGITGGIGTGKSLVSRIFEILGVPVYYADEQAKYLMTENTSLRESILQLAGKDAYNGKSLNRSYLAQVIFNDPEILKKINSLVHPVVQQDFIEWTKKQIQASYVIEEAALLFESGVAEEFDHIIVVDAPLVLRTERIKKRDGLSEEEILNRMNKQIPQSEKVKKADWVIINDEKSLVIPKLIDLHNKFVSLHHRK
mgnify:CR=1 FL=1